MKKKLVVIPSDSISAYENKGTSSWLEDYYNPDHFFDEVYVLSPKEKEERKAYGLNIIPVKSNKHYRKLLKEINPLYVRAYGGYWATDWAIYNKVSDIPVVSSVHDTNEKLLHKSLRFSDHYFVMSKVIRSLLIDKRIANPDEIDVLGNRVNTDIFRRIPMEQNPLKDFYPGKKIILGIGRKSSQKNFETLIHSLRFLPDDYILVLIGKGDIGSYDEIINKYKLNNRIINFEKVENNELPFWYNRADVFCVPSRWEGFGVVFIEAAACQTKIVTSNIAPMNEYLINDKEMNYLIDDYENPESLAKAIFYMINQNKFNNRTWEKIKKQFSTEYVGKKEVSLYKKVKYQGKENSIEYIIWKWNFSLKRIIRKGKNVIKRLIK